MTDQKPWNVWRGVTEGDMLNELEELDAMHGWFGTRTGMELMDTEALRKLWWRSIGVFQFGTDDQIDAELDG